MKQSSITLLVVSLLLGAGAEVVLAQNSPTINPFPSRVFGQPAVNNPVVSTSPNLVEGRELWQPQGVAVDTSVSPPILYVADTANNRVLAWRNATALSAGNKADLVIGQRDLYSTLPQGPRAQSSGGLSTGLAAPTGLAVDSSGNLYVVDAGNNRILRYPKPFSQTSALLSVDLVIGQKNVSCQSNTSSCTSANQGQQSPDANTLSLTSGTVYSTGIAFGPQGNLWVSDRGNNRVLRFAATALTANNNDPSADTVIGQTSFTTNTQPKSTSADPFLKTGLQNPSAITVDPQSGALYVADAYGRVLYYNSPAAQFQGQAADRVLGVQVNISGQPAPALPNAVALGAPAGLFVINNSLWVCDPAYSRIVRYDPPDKWTAESQANPSPAATAAFGQSDFSLGKVNAGQTEPSAFTLAFVTAAAYSGAEVFVADTGNNRVLALPVQNNILNPATRVVGQINFPFNAANLVEGRELYIFGGSSNNFVIGGSDIALDNSANPPHLYVSDSLNNRVLCFRDARNVHPGDKADLVIGQQDFNRVLVNAPNGNSQLLNDTGLNNPTGLLVDAAGNLYVADTLNGRVLRFPSPFSQPSGSMIRANLVLGQTGFTSKVTDASQQNMAAPYGLAQFNDGSIVVSDASQNRVLVFRKPDGGDFTNGQSAAIVFGQNGAPAGTDFTSVLSGAASGQMYSPRHLATDTSDRLYVCDTGNNRVQVFTRASTSANNPPAALVLPGFSSPHGIAVSAATGEIWVTDTFYNSGNARVLKFPEYQTLILNPTQATYSVPAAAPMAVALDAYDNLLVAEASNRVSFYYTEVIFQNAASYATTQLAPGEFAYLYRLGVDFDNTTQQAPADQFPLPAVVADTQVLMNGSPVPIYELVPGRIDFLVPMNAPQSGTAEFMAIRKSTGQVLGVSNLPMAPSSPGLFTSNATGNGLLAASNEDGTINSSANPALRSHYVSLYLTGQGPVQNAPADGMPASGLAPASLPVRVLINSTPVPDADVQTSLVNWFPGVLQINAKVPDSAQPLTANSVVVLINDTPSNIGPNGVRLQTTIYVK